MMREVAKLAPAGATWGYLLPAAYQQTVTELLSTKSTPVISKAPTGAYSYAVWNKAFK
jgi:NitT/TauT family transport system substrate-binding protein